MTLPDLTPGPETKLGADFEYCCPQCSACSTTPVVRPGRFFMRVQGDGTWNCPECGTRLGLTEKRWLLSRLVIVGAVLIIGWFRRNLHGWPEWLLYGLVLLVAVFLARHLSKTEVAPVPPPKTWE